MGKTVKKEHRFLGIMSAIWIFCIIMLVWISNVRGSQPPGISMEQFASSMEVIQDDARTGADIRLLQAIHGAGGIDYRYAVDTDCPKWDFHTKYISGMPLGWVDETSSAVEVVIHDIQVRFGGTVYASGQYYTVPVLGGISSEDIPFGTWKENLVKQAYQAYASETMTSVQSLPALKCLVCGIPVVIAVWVRQCRAKHRKRKKITNIDDIFKDDMDKVQEENCTKAAPENDTRRDELETYKAIGTPDDCRTAADKQEAKAPYTKGQGHEADVYCPSCCHHLGGDQEWLFDQTPYCPHCGQKLKEYL